MRVTDDGVPVEDLIAAVKEAIKTANLSSTDTDRDLKVGSVRLVLHTIATRSSGGSASFTVPFIGMEFKLGGKITRRNTHEIEINLVPPPPSDGVELRGFEEVLVQAIETIRAAVASAAGGDDPFILKDSSVTISFAVTSEGTISIGIDGSLSEDLTHTLVLGLAPA